MDLILFPLYLALAYGFYKLYNWSFRRWMGEKPYLKDLPLPAMVGFTLVVAALISPTVLLWLLHLVLRSFS